MPVCAADHERIAHIVTGVPHVYGFFPQEPKCSLIVKNPKYLRGEFVISPFQTGTPAQLAGV
ncbi:MAG: hypothetical protein ACLR56_09125 [Oscillospiraceae bacterium]